MGNTRITLPIEGMTCGACATTVQKRLLREAGVKDATVNYATGKSTVTIEDGEVRVADLVRAVRDSGYDCAKASLTFGVDGLLCPAYFRQRPIRPPTRCLLSMSRAW
jgi:copper chaperone CopZ